MTTIYRKCYENLMVFGGAESQRDAMLVALDPQAVPRRDAENRRHIIQTRARAEFESDHHRFSVGPGSTCEIGFGAGRPTRSIVVIDCDVPVPSSVRDELRVLAALGFPAPIVLLDQGSKRLTENEISQLEQHAFDILLTAGFKINHAQFVFGRLDGASPPCVGSLRSLIVDAPQCVPHPRDLEKRFVIYKATSTIAGVTVEGTLLQGRIQVGDELKTFGGKESTIFRVVELAVFSKPAREAEAGDRLLLTLTGDAPRPIPPDGDLLGDPETPVVRRVTISALTQFRSWKPAGQIPEGEPAIGDTVDVQFEGDVAFHGRRRFGRVIKSTSDRWLREDVIWLTLEFSTALPLAPGYVCSIYADGIEHAVAHGRIRSVEQ